MLPYMTLFQVKDLHWIQITREYSKFDNDIFVKLLQIHLCYHYQRKFGKCIHLIFYIPSTEFFRFMLFIVKENLNSVIHIHFIFYIE